MPWGVPSSVTVAQPAVGVPVHSTVWSGPASATGGSLLGPGSPLPPKAMLKILTPGEPTNVGGTVVFSIVYRPLFLSMTKS